MKYNIVIIIYINYTIIIIICITNNNAIINNNFARLQDLNFGLKNSHGHAKEFLRNLWTIWALTLKKFASPGLGYPGSP